MTKLMHSLPWTLALTLAAQAAESEAIRIPDAATLQECMMDRESPEGTVQNPGYDPALCERIKKSLEM
jgi:hypothetical protein